MMVNQFQFLRLILRSEERYGGCGRLVMPLIVGQAYAGSNPVSRPEFGRTLKPSRETKFVLVSMVPIVAKRTRTPVTSPLKRTVCKSSWTCQDSMLGPVGIIRIGFRKQTG